MSKKEKEAADKAEIRDPNENDGASFGIPDPVEEKEVRAGIEAKRSEKMVEDADAETNRKGHVKVSKHGQEIHVHPSTLSDHLRQGWNLA